MQKYVVLNKKVGQTPLQCIDLYKEQHPELADVPMTYAGRLDPLASGKLLILIGDECKKKEHYLHLDKQYTFQVLFGVQSDTADIMGRLTYDQAIPFEITKKQLSVTTKTLIGPVELPYPHFSSKTVQGKPLHTWAAEGRIDEIKIPTKHSTIYNLRCTALETSPRQEIFTRALSRINSIPPVTELRKALGNDFRREDVRKDWGEFLKTKSPNDVFFIATFSCTASSGTYMRTLAEVIAKQMNTNGLAFSIHRTKIGTFKRLPFIEGIWKKKYI
jgi:tRNA pseudouridine(55) synthase